VIIRQGSEALSGLIINEQDFLIQEGKIKYDDDEMF